MTRNEHRDGPPQGLWARAAKSPRGEYGVAFGYGPVQTGFVAEQALPDFFLRNVDSTGDAADILALVRDAAATLPRMKATVRHVRSAERN